MIIVAALYQFAEFPNFADFRASLMAFCKAQGVRGTLLLAREGINGTIAGSREGIDAVVAYLGEIGPFKNLEYKESFAESMPFMRLKIKLKKEIVTLGVPAADPRQMVGTYLGPDDWNALISRPDVITIDTRNDYEVMIGTFKGAVNPKTDTFKEFVAYTENNLMQYKDKPVAMFCTGGIRCERSTSYLKAIGFKEVYHLKGGILKYLEEIPEEKSLWEGECFVFDQRVAVKHGLEIGSYELCFGCRMPISAEDKTSEHYLEGVHCPHCYSKHNAAHYARVSERQKQVQLAKARGQKHIGDVCETRPTTHSH
jgi:UPF0176 protein